jgi:heme exporter protein C
MIKTFNDPMLFYRFAGGAVKPLFCLAMLLAAVGLYMTFFVCPIDATQGNSYRILFIHVPAAWMSLLVYVLMAFFSLFTLAYGNRMSAVMAQALAPTGALMCFMALFSGAFWGRPTWGAYWVWDARLTSELILLFLYLGFMALQSSIADRRRADSAGAVIALVCVVNVPIIYFSVRWWNTLHQGASIGAGGSSMATIMLCTLLVMVGAFTCYGLATVLARSRSVILERERRENWARKAAIKGEL